MQPLSVSRKLILIINTQLCSKTSTGFTTEQTDFSLIMSLAEKHKIAPLIVDALHESRSAEKMPEYVTFKKLARMQVLQQAQREMEFLEVYGKLKEAGIRALVVKGCVCRAVWPKGDLRVSGDEDLYVRDEDFAKACGVLRECGLVCDKRANPETDFEIGWCRPNSTLYIELHRRLFMPDSAAADLQRFFNDAFDRAQEYEVEHGAAKVWSMSPEDHLLYLFLHAYKHFINSGFGIRQVCDIGLWMRKNAPYINQNHIMVNLSEAHALYFARAVFSIAEKDLGIELPLQACWNDIQVDREPMLRDLFAAGVYGGSSMSRRHSAPLTSEAVAASRENRKKAGLLQRVFPPKEALMQDYPELKEHPERLLAVWAKRLLKYRKETKNDENNSAAESIRIAKEREELLKLYRII